MPPRPAPTTARRRLLLLGAAGAVLVGVLLHESQSSSTSSAAGPFGAPQHVAAPTSDTEVGRAAPSAPPPGRVPLDEQGDDAGLPSGRLGVADGVVPRGTTVFADVPAVAKLDPALLAALRRAAGDAAREHVPFLVDSGWRSAAYQEQLLRAAISKYGSEEQAARWVATPSTSQHVSGHAVDLGAKAAAWLSRHGARYGLCQIYRNERWHYELRPDAVTQGCPAMYADPTQDPRLQ